MRSDTFLPKLSMGVVTTVLREINVDSTGYNDKWVQDMLVRIKLSDSVFFGFICNTVKHSGPTAATTALVAYRMFESQIEINQLEEQFNEGA